MNNQTPKLFSTIVPGGMSLEEWSAGGFSKFLHGDGSCKAEIVDAIEKFKFSLIEKLNILIDIDMADKYSINTTIQSFIINYKPKN